MNKKVICKIRCLNCGEWFESGIFLGDETSYLGTSMEGNKQQCPHCNNMTDCNKENMMFESRNGAKVLHIEGDQTYQKDSRD